MVTSDLEAAGIREDNFYLRVLKPSGFDLRGITLVSTSFMVAGGFACYAVIAWLFKEAVNLPALTKSLTIGGAWLLALGAEFTTPLTVFEVYRKLNTEEHSRWDWLALFASVGATITTLAIAVAGLLEIDPQMVEKVAELPILPTLLTILSLWPAFVAGYAPIVLVACSSADAYATFMETGLYLRLRDRKRRTYEGALAEWSRWGATHTGWAANDTTQQTHDEQLSGVTATYGADYTPVMAQPTTQEPQAFCWCGEPCPLDKSPPNWYSAHMRHTHKPQVEGCESATEAVATLRKLYPNPPKENTIAEFPRARDIAHWRKNNNGE